MNCRYRSEVPFDSDFMGRYQSAAAKGFNVDLAGWRDFKNTVIFCADFLPFWGAIKIVRMSSFERVFYSLLHTGSGTRDFLCPALSLVSSTFLTSISVFLEWRCIFSGHSWEQEIENLLLRPTTTTTAINNGFDQRKEEEEAAKMGEKLTNFFHSFLLHLPRNTSNLTICIFL